MKIINNIFDLKEMESETSLAIGAFDGIHSGHRAVIQGAIDDAKKNNRKSVVFTFSNHPRALFGKAPKMITSNRERALLLEKLGVDYLVLQEFNWDFAKLTPLDFIELLKEKLNTASISVGFNWRFGKGGVATTDDLNKIAKGLNITTNIVEPVNSREDIISSTVIRSAIENGDLDSVKKHLGYNFFIIGEVVHGIKLGRKLGFPTANLNLLNKIYPPLGIYGAKVKIENRDGIYDALINIGNKPTVSDEHEVIVEVHILDFDEYIYGEEIYVEVVEYLREEKKFDSLEELKEAMESDVITWKERIKEVTK